MTPSKSAGLPDRLPPRAIIENLQPEIDAGRFPIKRTVGELVVVTADIFTDGHDALAAVLRYRAHSDRDWHEIAMAELVNDAWTASFTVLTLEPHYYTVSAWVDRFKSWLRDFRKRVDAGQDVTVDLLMGAELVEQAAARAIGNDAAQLNGFAKRLRDKKADAAERSEFAFAPEVAALVFKYPDRTHAAHYQRELRITVDRERARFSAWYELFPRSAGEAGNHGTFADVEKRLEYVAGMGFDVLYLPPVHPIGRVNRKGRNNTLSPVPEDPGSPWAIGGEEGGHNAIHPQLGSLADFKRLLRSARDQGLELAMDLAFQTTPDHPYAREHKSWFRQRPDGTIQYAENPPKKYQDIYPFDFESEDWQALWTELKTLMEYWIEQGVRIFRVDNPHTKPFAFWEWAIADIKARFPETIFLSEAFTRPKVMYRLAKLGFNQSYTYFTWRNTKWELTEYLTELTQTLVREFFRPNFWPNTPDILSEYLQYGGRPAFIIRLILAATMSSNYGIYGPAFELLEHVAVAPGKEEYQNSEKYEIRQWDLDRTDSLRQVIARVNRIRRDNRALQSNHNFRFHPIDNDQIIAYSKATHDLSNLVVMVVNLDPYHTQSGWLDLPLEEFEIDPHQAYQVHDLLGEGRYFWQGARNFVQLNPHVLPAHILSVRRRVRTEQDFDYFM